LPMTNPSALVGGTQTCPSGQVGVGGAASWVSAAVATGAEATGGGGMVGGGGEGTGVGARATGGATGEGAGVGEAAQAAERASRKWSGGRIAMRSDNAGARGGNFAGGGPQRPLRTESHAPSAIPASAARTQMTIHRGEVRSGATRTGCTLGSGAVRGIGMDGA